MVVIWRENMLDLKFCFGTPLVFICLVVCGVQFSAAASKQPTTWWPDPSTGLMWAGRTPGTAMNWKEANDYCAALQLGGYSGWRLPTLDEVKAITYLRTVRGYFKNGDTGDFWIVKGGILVEGGTLNDMGYWVWTSSTAADKNAWMMKISAYFPNEGTNTLSSPMSSSFSRVALCTRPMEAEILQFAKDAQVNVPVPDILTLKAYVPLNKARIAFHAGQYQESIDQAKNALWVKSDFAPAYWGMGISYGMMGQWDFAITNLEAALKIDKDYGDAKDALKWAKEGQKAAKSGGKIKTQSPQWD